MAATSLYGTFNLGTDLSVTVIDNTTGQPVGFGGRLVSFKGDPLIDQITSSPIDNQGYDQKRQIRKGHNITMMIDRASGDLDILDSIVESEYHNNIAQRTYGITALVNNGANAAPTVIVYAICLIELKTSGDYAKDKKVEVTLDAWAQSRVVTGG